MNIKKTSWSYKLLVETYSWLPENTCGFYWYLFLALILSPITLVSFILEKPISYIIGDIPESTSLVIESKKWNMLATNSAIVFFSYCGSIIITLIIFAIPSCFQPDDWLRNNLSLFFLKIPVIGVFVYTFLIYYSVKLFRKIKPILCKPVKYE